MREDDVTRDTPIRELPLSTRARNALVTHLMEWHGYGRSAPLRAVEEVMTANDIRHRTINIGPVVSAEIIAFLRGPDKPSGAGL